MKQFDWTLDKRAEREGKSSEQRRKLAQDYAVGRSDARMILDDFEQGQLELWDDRDGT